MLFSSGNVDNPYGFSTKEYSPKSGLVYFGARYYDPRVGRFNSRDPIDWMDLFALARKQPWQIHDYLYCANNPVNWIDPWGLKQEKPWWEKIEEGYYYGTGFSEEALEYYAQRWSETGWPLWAVPGFFAALWTPQTYQRTGWTLVGGYIANQLFVKHVGTWAHWEHARGPHKFPHLQFGEKYIKVAKWVLDLLRRKIKF